MGGVGDAAAGAAENSRILAAGRVRRLWQRQKFLCPLLLLQLLGRGGILAPKEPWQYPQELSHDPREGCSFLLGERDPSGLEISTHTHTPVAWQPSIPCP